MKTHIFIPYLLTPDNGEELKVTLRSIDHNILFDYDVVVFGDQLPTWLNTKSIIHIDVKFPMIVPFNTFWDTISKLRHYSSLDTASESILYTYDDIVFMQPVTLIDVKKLVALSYLPQNDDFKSDAGLNWRKVLVNTMHKLKEHKLPYLNYETHLPIAFERDRLRRFFQKFAFDKEPYHMCSLYCNWANDVDNREVSILSKIPNQKIKFGIYRGCEIKDYNIISDYMFLNWTQSEWKPELRNFLMSEFPKSKFEL